MKSTESKGYRLNYGQANYVLKNTAQQKWVLKKKLEVECGPCKAIPGDHVIELTL